MRKKTPHISSLSRALDMLEAVLADGGRSPVSAIARTIGMPVATAHRQVTTLVEAGFLQPLAGGGQIAGPRLLGLRACLDDRQIIVHVATPLLQRLADQLGCMVQLGTLDDDMVTYHLKIGRGSASLFTRVGMQLEAYCSGVGKVLLAALPDAELAAYLATGPFPALTPQTITDPAALRHELMHIRHAGHAADREEVVEGLCCLAVPVRSGSHTLAALSASWPRDEMTPRLEAASLPPMQQTATAIGAMLDEILSATEPTAKAADEATGGD